MVIWATDLNNTGTAFPFRHLKRWAVLLKKLINQILYIHIECELKVPSEKAQGRHVGKWDHKTLIVLFLAVNLEEL